MVLILDLWLRARLPENVTVCMDAVVAVVVAVARVAAVAVLGGLCVTVSADAAVALSLVGSDDCVLLSFLRCGNPPPRFLH